VCSSDLIDSLDQWKDVTYVHKCTCTHSSPRSAEYVHMKVSGF